MPDRDTDLANPRGVVRVLLAAAFGAAFVGFFVGTRHVPIEAPPPSPTASHSALPGQTYEQLRARRYGPNSRVSSRLEVLRAELPKIGDPVTRTEAQRVAAVAARAQRRAYDGAPPVIPHPIDEQNPAGCLACHQTGMRVQGLTAPVLSHPPYAQCTQCHAPNAGRAWADASPAENTFAGLTSGGPGSRAWDGAPPTMPHGEWMRQACESCHGVAGLPGIRTTHPERQNCRQCHAPDNSPVPWEVVR